MPRSPETDHDWIVHSVNIHGIFFERWCQLVISETPGWSVDAVNYPVEFPPPNGPIRGKETTLDIRASTKDGDQKLSLLVECKKNNPEFINWIFFRKPASGSNHAFNIPQVENKLREPPGTGWSTNSSIVNFHSDYAVADEARETRADYLSYKGGSKTKTSNAAIHDAAYQVALATQAIVSEDQRVSNTIGFGGASPPMPWRTKLYLPTILTTARLFLCDFNAQDVDPSSGEIPFDKVKITQSPQLVFESPLPRHLQFGPAVLAPAFREGFVDQFTRMHVLVVPKSTLERSAHRIPRRCPTQTVGFFLTRGRLTCA